MTNLPTENIISIGMPLRESAMASNFIYNEQSCLKSFYDGRTTLLNLPFKKANRLDKVVGFADGKYKLHLARSTQTMQNKRVVVARKRKSKEKMDSYVKPKTVSENAKPGTNASGNKHKESQKARKQSNPTLLTSSCPEGTFDLAALPRRVKKMKKSQVTQVARVLVGSTPAPRTWSYKNSFRRAHARGKLHGPAGGKTQVKRTQRPPQPTHVPAPPRNSSKRYKRNTRLSAQGKLARACHNLTSPRGNGIAGNLVKLARLEQRLIRYNWLAPAEATTTVRHRQRQTRKATLAKPIAPRFSQDKTMLGLLGMQMVAPANQQSLHDARMFGMICESASYGGQSFKELTGVERRPTANDIARRKGLRPVHAYNAQLALKCNFFKNVLDMTSLVINTTQSSVAILQNDAFENHSDECYDDRESEAERWAQTETNLINMMSLLDQSESYEDFNETVAKYYTFIPVSMNLRYLNVILLSKACAHPLFNNERQIDKATACVMSIANNYCARKGIAMPEQLGAGDAEPDKWQLQEAKCATLENGVLLTLVRCTDYDIEEIDYCFERPSETVEHNEDSLKPVPFLKMVTKTLDKNFSAFYNFGKVDETRKLAECPNCHKVCSMGVKGEEGKIGVECEPHCGHCGSGMESIIVDFVANPIGTIPITDRDAHFGARALQQSALMQYLDGIAWTDSSTFKAVAISHDLRIVHNMLSRYNYHVLTCDTNVSSSLMHFVGLKIPGLEIVRLTNSNNVCADERLLFKLSLYLANTHAEPELSIMTNATADVVEETCQLRTVVTKQPSATNDSNGICNHVSMQELSNVDLLDLFELATSNPETVIMLPTVEDYGMDAALELPVQVVVEDGECYVLHNDSTKPTVIGKRVIDTMELEPVLVHDRFFVRVYKLLSTHGFAIYKLKRCTKLNELDKSVRVCVKEDNTTATIPFVDESALLNAALPTVFTPKTVQLNKVLLRSMLARAMGNETTNQWMLDYGIGVAHSKYTRFSVSKDLNNFTDEQVLSHAYVALMLTNRMTVKRQVLLSIQSSSAHKLVATLGSAAINTAARWATRGRGDWQQLTSEIFRTVDTVKLNTLTTAAEDPVWDELHQWCAEATISKLPYLTLTEAADVAELRNSGSVCDDHNDSCNHANTGYDCPHCQQQISDAVSELCICCAKHRPKPQCNHEQMDVVWSNEPRKCDCCGDLREDPCTRCTPEDANLDLTNFMHNLLVAAEEEERSGKVSAMANKGNATARIITVLVNGIETEVFDQKSPASKLEGKWHGHVCVKCGTRYKHEHGGSDADGTANVLHYQFAGDCLTCFPEVAPMRGSKPWPAILKREPREPEAEPKAIHRSAVPKDLSKTHREPLLSDLFKDTQPEQEPAMPDDESDIPIKIGNLIKYHGTNKATMLLSEGQMIETLDCAWQSSDKAFTLSLPALPCGTIVCDNTIIESLEAKDIVLSEGTCVLDAWNAASGQVIPLSDMIGITEKLDWWDEKDITKVAQKMGRNVIVVSNAVHFNTYSNSDDYTVLVHSRANTENRDHMLAGELTLKRRPDQQVRGFSSNSQAVYDTAYKLATGGVGGYDSSLSLIATVRTEHRMLQAAEQLKLTDKFLAVMPKVARDRQKKTDYFTNNAAHVHDVSAGLVHIAVRPEHTGILALLAGDSAVNVKDDEFLSAYDVPVGEELDVDAQITNEIKNCVFEILKCANGMKNVDNPWKHMLLYSANHKITKVGKECVVKVNDTVKSFDFMDLTDLGIPDLVMVTPRANMIAVSASSIRYARLGTQKSSAGSHMRRLLAALTTNVTKSRMEKLLANSSGLVAPAGHGKTTIIAKEYNTNQAFMTQTRSAKEVLTRKLLETNLTKKPDITTSERAGLDKTHSEVLVIDEATMFTPLSVALTLSPKVTSLKLYGDKFQIGVVDMRSMGGKRSARNIIDMLPEGRLVEAWTTRRLGRTLVAELGRIKDLEKLETHPDATHDTTFSTHYLPDLNWEAVLAILHQAQPNTVLCFYEKHLSELKALLGRDSTISVELSTPQKLRNTQNTVHRYQGEEADRVAVLQAPLTAAATFGVFTDPKYCLSAATRARLELTWISASCHSASTPLHARIAGFHLVSQHNPAGASNQNEALQTMVAKIRDGRLDSVETRNVVRFALLERIMAVMKDQCPSIVDTYDVGNRAGRTVIEIVLEESYKFGRLEGFLADRKEALQLSAHWLLTGDDERTVKPFDLELLYGLAKFITGNANKSVVGAVEQRLMASLDHVLGPMTQAVIEAATAGTTQNEQAATMRSLMDEDAAVGMVSRLMSGSKPTTSSAKQPSGPLQLTSNETITVMEQHAPTQRSLMPVGQPDEPRVETWSERRDALDTTLLGVQEAASQIYSRPAWGLPIGDATHLNSKEREETKQRETFRLQHEQTTASNEGAPTAMPKSDALVTTREQHLSPAGAQPEEEEEYYMDEIKLNPLTKTLSPGLYVVQNYEELSVCFTSGSGMQCALHAFNSVGNKTETLDRFSTGFSQEHGADAIVKAMKRNYPDVAVGICTGRVWVQKGHRTAAKFTQDDFVNRLMELHVTQPTNKAVVFINNNYHWSPLICSFRKATIDATQLIRFKHNEFIKKLIDEFLFTFCCAMSKDDMFVLEQQCTSNRNKTVDYNTALLLDDDTGVPALNVQPGQIQNQIVISKVYYYDKDIMYAVKDKNGLAGFASRIQSTGTQVLSARVPSQATLTADTIEEEDMTEAEEQMIRAAIEASKASEDVLSAVHDATFSVQKEEGARDTQTGRGTGSITPREDTKESTKAKPTTQLTIADTPAEGRPAESDAQHGKPASPTEAHTANITSELESKRLARRAERQARLDAERTAASARAQELALQAEVTLKNWDRLSVEMSEAHAKDMAVLAAVTGKVPTTDDVKGEQKESKLEQSKEDEFVATLDLSIEVCAHVLTCQSLTDLIAGTANMADASVGELSTHSFERVFPHIIAIVKHLRKTDADLLSRLIKKAWKDAKHTALLAKLIAHGPVSLTSSYTDISETLSVNVGIGVFSKSLVTVTRSADDERMEVKNFDLPGYSLGQLGDKLNTRAAARALHYISTAISRARLPVTSTATLSDAIDLAIVMHKSATTETPRTSAAIAAAERAAKSLIGDIKFNVKSLGVLMRLSSEISAMASRASERDAKGKRVELNDGEHLAAKKHKQQSSILTPSEQPTPIAATRARGKAFVGGFAGTVEQMVRQPAQLVKKQKHSKNMWCKGSGKGASGETGRCCGEVHAQTYQLNSARFYGTLNMAGRRRIRAISEYGTGLWLSSLRVKCRMRFGTYWLQPINGCAACSGVVVLDGVSNEPVLYIGEDYNNWGNREIRMAAYKEATMWASFFGVQGLDNVSDEFSEDTREGCARTARVFKFTGFQLDDDKQYMNMLLDRAIYATISLAAFACQSAFGEEWQSRIILDPQVGNKVVNTQTTERIRALQTMLGATAFSEPDRYGPYNHSRYEWRPAQLEFANHYLLTTNRPLKDGKYRYALDNTYSNEQALSDQYCRYLKAVRDTHVDPSLSAQEREELIQRAGQKAFNQASQLDPFNEAPEQPEIERQLAIDAESTKPEAVKFEVWKHANAIATTASDYVPTENHEDEATATAQDNLRTWLANNVKIDIDEFYSMMYQEYVQATTYKLTKWVHAIIRDKGARALAFAGPLDNTILAKEHVTDQTIVQKYLLDYAGKMETKKLKYEGKPLFMNRAESLDYADEVKALYPNMHIGEHTMPYRGGNLPNLVEQLNMNALLSRHKRITCIGRRPHLATLADIGTVEYYPMHTSDAVYTDNKSIATTQLKSRWHTDLQEGLKSKPDDPEWLKRYNKDLSQQFSVAAGLAKSQISNVDGPLMYSHTIEKTPRSGVLQLSMECADNIEYWLELLAKLHEEGDELVIQLPMATSLITAMKRSPGPHAVEGSDYAYQPSAALTKAIATNGQIWVSSQGYEVEVVYSNKILTTLVFKRWTPSDTKAYSPLTTIVDGGFEYKVMRLKFLNTSLMGTARKMSTTSIHEFNVNVRLLRLLRLRCLRESTSAKDLIQYSRMQMQVRYYTTKNIVDRYKMMSDVATDTAVVAYISTQKLLRQHANLRAMSDLAPYKGTLADTKSAVTNLLEINKHEMLDTVRGIIAMAIEYLGIDASLTDVLDIWKRKSTGEVREALTDLVREVEEWDVDTALTRRVLVRNSSRRDKKPILMTEPYHNIKQENLTKTVDAVGSMLEDIAQLQREGTARASHLMGTLKDAVSDALEQPMGGANAILIADTLEKGNLPRDENLREDDIIMIVVGTQGDVRQYCSVAACFDVTTSNRLKRLYVHRKLAPLARVLLGQADKLKHVEVHATSMDPELLRAVAVEFENTTGIGWLRGVWAMKSKVRAAYGSPNTEMMSACLSGCHVITTRINVEANMCVKSANKLTWLEPCHTAATMSQAGIHALSLAVTGTVCDIKPKASGLVLGTDGWLGKTLSKEITANGYKLSLAHLQHGVDEIAQARFDAGRSRIDNDKAEFNKRLSEHNKAKPDEASNSNDDGESVATDRSATETPHYIPSVHFYIPLGEAQNWMPEIMKMCEAHYLRVTISGISEEEWESVQQEADSSIEYLAHTLTEPRYADAVVFQNSPQMHMFTCGTGTPYAIKIHSDQLFEPPMLQGTVKFHTNIRHITKSPAFQYDANTVHKHSIITMRTRSPTGMQQSTLVDWAEQFNGAVDLHKILPSWALTSKWHLTDNWDEATLGTVQQFGGPIAFTNNKWFAHVHDAQTLFPDMFVSNHACKMNISHGHIQDGIDTTSSEQLSELGYTQLPAGARHDKNDVTEVEYTPTSHHTQALDPRACTMAPVSARCRLCKVAGATLCFKCQYKEELGTNQRELTNFLNVHMPRLVEAYDNILMTATGRAMKTDAEFDSLQRHYTKALEDQANKQAKSADNVKDAQAIARTQQTLAMQGTSQVNIGLLAQASASKQIDAAKRATKAPEKDVTVSLTKGSTLAPNKQVTRLMRWTNGYVTHLTPPTAQVFYPLEWCEVEAVSTRLSKDSNLADCFAQAVRASTAAGRFVSSALKFSSIDGLTKDECLGACLRMGVNPTLVLRNVAHKYTFHPAFPRVQLECSFIGKAAHIELITSMVETTYKPETVKRVSGSISPQVVDCVSCGDGRLQASTMTCTKDHTLELASSYIEIVHEINEGSSVFAHTRLLAEHSGWVERATMAKYHHIETSKSITSPIMTQRDNAFSMLWSTAAPTTGMQGILTNFGVKVGFFQRTSNTTGDLYCTMFDGEVASGLFVDMRAGLPQPRLSLTRPAQEVGALNKQTLLSLGAPTGLAVTDACKYLWVADYDNHDHHRASDDKSTFNAFAAEHILYGHAAVPNADLTALLKSECGKIFELVTGQLTTKNDTHRFISRVNRSAINIAITGLAPVKGELVRLPTLEPKEITTNLSALAHHLAYTRNGVTDSNAHNNPLQLDEYTMSHVGAHESAKKTMESTNREILALQAEVTKLKDESKVDAGKQTRLDMLRETRAHAKLHEALLNTVGKDQHLQLTEEAAMVLANTPLFSDHEQYAKLREELIDFNHSNLDTLKADDYELMAGAYTHWKQTGHQLMVGDKIASGSLLIKLTRTTKAGYSDTVPERVRVFDGPIFEDEVHDNTAGYVWGATHAAQHNTRKTAAIVGPPGSGKSTLYSRFPSMLNDIDEYFNSAESKNLLVTMWRAGFKMDTMNADFTVEYCKHMKRSAWMRRVRKERKILLVWNELWAHELYCEVVGSMHVQLRDEGYALQYLQGKLKSHFKGTPGGKGTLSQLIEKFPQLQNLEALQCTHFEDKFCWDEVPARTEALEGFSGLYIDPDVSGVWQPGEPMSDDVPADVIELWEDTDLTAHITNELPMKDIKLRGHEMITHYKTVTKLTLTKYPLYSRPVLTDMANVTRNAVSQRLGSIINLRKFHLDPKVEVKRIAKAMFVDDCDDLSKAYRSKPISIRAKETLEWIAGRPKNMSIGKELDAIVQEGFSTHPLNDLKVHAKVESLLKYDAQRTWIDAARIILWQQKGLCAIFAPVFLEAKKRLKSLMSKKVVYTDGLRPEELSAMFRLIPAGSYILEDDLAKQDRQTDDDLLDVEFEMYAYLGVHEATLSLWRQIHRNWRLKGNTVRAAYNAMRMTGQATTSIGNTIVNLTCHSRLVTQHASTLLGMFILGDDVIAFFSDKPSVTRLRKQIADYYNMQSKSFVSQNAGNYLQMIAYPNAHGTMELGPDLKRLRNKFEVTNGRSAFNIENMIARKMSYMSILGNTPEIAQIIADEGLPISPQRWYDPEACAEATARHHNMSLAAVHNDYALLIKYFQADQAYMKDFVIAAESKH